LVFLDETGVNSALMRFRGWSDGRARVNDCVSDVRFEQVLFFVAAAVFVWGECLGVF